MFPIILFFVHFEVLAQPTTTISQVSLSNILPLAGSTLSVTVSFCDTNYYGSFNFVAGISTTNTLEACSSANQMFDVYSNGTNLPWTNNPGCCGYNPGTPGSLGVTTCGNSPSTITQVWTVSLPATLAGGTYYYFVATDDYSAKCGDTNYNFNSAQFTVPLPTPGCTVIKTAEGPTVAPNGLVLFNIAYTFVNTTNFVLTDQIPGNTTPVTMSPGGSLSGNTVTWNLYNGAATTQQSGNEWVLLSVNTGVSNGSLINNTAVGTAAGAPSGPVTSNTASSTVQVPIGNLVKSESVSSIGTGNNVSYNLDWVSTGQDLQFYDSYDNVPVAAGVSTGGSSVPWGYDLTNYTDVPAASDPGTWVVDSDALGNNFLSASVSFDSSGGSGRYPVLVRNGPGLDICDDFSVEGDIQIPVTALGATNGGDGHMVVAANASQGITYEVAISQNSAPAYEFYQKNNNPIPGAAGSNALVINQGVWYTLLTNVQFSSGGAGVSFTTILWQTNNPSNATTFSYVDTSTPLPTCSGGWDQGWRADETAGTDWFSNLKVFGPGPLVNALVWDVVPSGVTYVSGSANAGGVYNAGTNAISWVAPTSFPVTMYSFNTPISWTGTAYCPGPIVNQATISSSSLSSNVVSNPVTLAITGSCITYTPTVTPTITNTPLPGATNTFTVTPTATFSPTLTYTLTPTHLPTSQQHPAIPPQSQTLPPSRILLLLL